MFYQNYFGKKFSSSVSGATIQSKRLQLPLPEQEPIAFHAVLEGNEYPHLGLNQIIKYNNTVLNLGDGYQPLQGVFAAPKSGIYMFSAAITSAANDHSTFWAELTKEGTPLARLNLYGRRGFADQSSVSAVTQLNAGDEVWVQIIQGSDISIWGDKYSYFTGVMVDEE